MKNLSTVNEGLAVLALTLDSHPIAHSFPVERVKPELNRYTFAYYAELYRNTAPQSAWCIDGDDGDMGHDVWFRIRDGESFKEICTHWRADEERLPEVISTLMKRFLEAWETWLVSADVEGTRYVRTK